MASPGPFQGCNQGVGVRGWFSCEAQLGKDMLPA